MCEQKLIHYQRKRGHLDGSYTKILDALTPFDVAEVKQHSEATTGVKVYEFSDEI